MNAVLQNPSLFLLSGRAVAANALHVGQQFPEKRMGAERRRVADKQQLATGAGHAHVHAADVGEEADFAVFVAARQ